MGRLNVFRTQGKSGQYVEGYLDYNDTTLSVTDAGIINPGGDLVTITANRASDGRQEVTVTSRSSLSGTIPPGRRQPLRQVVDDGVTLLAPPASWNLRWSVET